MKRYDLFGKKVLITGASSGIGRELARVFIREGARCILTAPPSERQALESVALELNGEFHSDVTFITCDLAEENGPRRLYDQACAIYPDIDILVNNAGIMAYGNFHEISLSLHESLLKVNVIAPLRLMHFFLNDMLARGTGRVLNVSSVSAFQPTMHHALYGAAKSLIQSLSESVAQEIKKSGVMVLTLNPGYTETPLLHGNNFPDRLIWYRIAGLSKASWVAKKSIAALKKNKAVCIPGIRNKIIHLVLVRFVPRRIINAITMIFLESTIIN